MKHSIKGRLAALERRADPYAVTINTWKTVEGGRRENLRTGETITEDEWQALPGPKCTFRIDTNVDEPFERDRDRP